jgi:hypothetical protein
MTPDHNSNRRGHNPRDPFDRDDPILDACLAEILGGETPPDLSDRILAAFLAQSGATASDDRSAQPRSTETLPTAPMPSRMPQVLPEPLAPAVLASGNGHLSVPAGAPRPLPNLALPAEALPAEALPSLADQLRQHHRRMQWMGLAAGLLVLLGGLAALKVLPDSKNGGGSNVAVQVNPAGANGTLAARQQATTEQANRKQRPGNRSRITVPGAGAGAPDQQTPVASNAEAAMATDSDGDHADGDDSDDDPLPERGWRHDPAAVAGTGGSTAGNAGANGELASAASPDSSRDAAMGHPTGGAVSSDADVIAYINALIRQRWEEAGVSPSAKATDAEWCRRVYLDVIGRIPTAEESLRFASDRAKDKRARLVDRLLDSDEYIEDFARNWTTIWTNILVGRNGGTEPNTLVSRDGLQQYLRRSFLRNKPYDQFVTDLVSAEGSNRPGTQDFNGAVNFLLHNLDENAAPATAKTAKIFLGVQVQCTQCHNHPFNDWKQNRFWEFNSFFRQARAQRVSQGDDASVRLIDADFMGEGMGGAQDAEVYYELRNGLLKAAWPVFVDGTAINPSGLVSDVNRRDELARLIVGSPMMPQALVNRLWGHFLGYGFTKPIDDMGPHNTPSHPELLERLAGDFAGHGFDLKQLIRWITLSEPYGLSSRVTDKNKVDDPTTGERPLFSHFYLRQMRPEELFHSLIVATNAQNVGGGDYAAVEQRKNEWLRQFTISFGTDENDETTTFNGTIPQTLMMWNGELVNNATSGAQGTYLHSVAVADTKSSQKINQLFTTALSRKPSAEELRIANEVWRLRGGDTMAALQDVWWVVLNSNEFIFNH